MKSLTRQLLAASFPSYCLISSATAEPWAAPGDMRLRHDLQLLEDAGGIILAITSWPLSWGDIGHGMDGDGLSYSLGSTLVQSAGHSWNILLRYMEINRAGAPNPRHTISATPQDLVDIQLTHNRDTVIGRFDIGPGYSQLGHSTSGATSNEVTAFVQWSAL